MGTKGPFISGPVKVSTPKPNLRVLSQNGAKRDFVDVVVKPIVLIKPEERNLGGILGF